MCALLAPALARGGLLGGQHRKFDLENRREGGPPLFQQLPTSGQDEFYRRKVRARGPDRIEVGPGHVAETDSQCLGGQQMAVAQRLAFPLDGRHDRRFSRRNRIEQVLNLHRRAVSKRFTDRRHADQGGTAKLIFRK